MKQIDVDPKSLNWSKVGKRIASYRVLKNTSIDDFAASCTLNASSIIHIENGHSYSSLNQLWSIIFAHKLSPRWLFFGEGAFDDFQEADLPPTLVRKRAAGLRKCEDRQAADEGQYSDDAFEFVLAVENFKQLNSKTFPTMTEIFDIVHSLGYRKVEKPIINPKQVMETLSVNHKSKPHSVKSVSKTH